jgi:predicted ATPase
MSPPNVPLRSWTVEGFKSIVSATVELRPLTIVVGANSSGKSSLLQSILLAAQAASIGVRGNVLPMHGPLVSVGSYDDAVSAVTRKRRRIAIGGSLNLPQGTRSRGADRAKVRGTGERGQTFDAISWDVHLAGSTADDPAAARIRQIQLHRARPETGLGSGFRLKASATGRARENPASLDGRLTLQGRSLAIHDVLLHDALPAAFLVARPETEFLLEQWVTAATTAALRRTREGGGRTSSEASGRELSDVVKDLAAEAVFDLSALRIEFPNLAPSDVARYFASQWESGPRSRRVIDYRLVTNLEKEIREIVISQLGEGELRWVEPDPRTATEVIDTASRVRDFLASIQYLGPLREQPRAVYEPAPSVLLGGVGIRGEYVTARLHAAGDLPVSCPTPGGEIQECTLAEAVATWLDVFDIGEGVTTRNLGRPGIELRLRDRNLDKDLDLTSVGVGVSQLLPIIVLCLSAPVGRVILIEQPELHLNPALQQTLGDFLIACARSGRQLIIETHSDHLVSRLRRHIAEDPADEVRQLLAILFAERFGGETQLRVIEPNLYGGIDDWPRNFFDQGAVEAQEILRAAIAKQSASSS